MCASLDRLKSLPKSLDQKQEVRQAYYSVIKNKLENSIIEEVTNTEINNSSKEFYMPHRVRVQSQKSCVLFMTLL